MEIPQEEPAHPELVGGDEETGATKHQRPTLSIILTFILTAVIVAAGVNWYKDSEAEMATHVTNPVVEVNVEAQAEVSQELADLREFKKTTLALHCQNSGGTWGGEWCECPNEPSVGYDSNGYCTDAHGDPMGIIGEGTRHNLAVMMGDVPEEVPVPEGYEHFVSQDGNYSFSKEEGSTVTEVTEDNITSFNVEKEDVDSNGTLSIERFSEEVDVLQVLAERWLVTIPNSHCVFEAVETERPGISNIVMSVSPDFPDYPELNCTPALSGLYWQLSDEWNAVITLPVGHEPFFTDAQYTVQSLVIHK